MAPPSFTIQATFACLASIANYVSQSDPSKTLKSEHLRTKSVDRIFEAVDERQFHWKALVVSTLLVRTLTVIQTIYLICLALSQTKTTFPTHFATPFFVFAIIGVSWRYWCFHTLDKFFTFRLQIQKGQKIIQTGPYRFLAHPSYLGMNMNTISISLATIGPLSPWLGMLSGDTRSIGQAIACVFGLLSLVHAFWLQKIRIADEERMMKEHFGKEYEDFLSTRWRVIPFVF